MKLLQSIYQDSNGDIWQIKKVFTTNKRGTVVTTWDGECQARNIGLYGSKKKELIEKIKNFTSKN